MVFTVLLYASLVFFLIGLVYKVSNWYRLSISAAPAEITTSNRLVSFIKGFLSVVFSLKLLLLVKCLILDVFLQFRTLREDFFRWLMHMFIYAGFVLLLLMHALGEPVTASLFSEYYSTINPFFFLRDLFGLVVIIGIGMAIYRRRKRKAHRLRTSRMDRYAIVILAVIIFSGILLEGVKITSHKAFIRMVEEWSDVEEEEELTALESFWVERFSLNSSELNGPFEEETLEMGMEIHEMNCAGCHSSPEYAFTGYLVAGLISPVSRLLDNAGAERILYYIHLLACFFGLAYLPFSKMFHIIATPVSLLSNSVMTKDVSDPANTATRQVMELDACTHCGTCSLYCSAMMAYEATENEYVLPSEKVQYLKSMISGGKTGPDGLRAILEGVHLCTNCDRCTVVCPSGINLRELWLGVREFLLQKGVPETLLLSQLSLVRGFNKRELIEEDYQKPLETTRKDVSGNFASLNDPEKVISFPVTDAGDTDLEIKDSTFSYCFGCQNCTTVCPVVNSFDNPQDVLGLLPHQIMCCLGFGLTEIATGPNMLWDCVTCYQCQEHCPQKVKVADILYDLKNMAVRRVTTQVDRL